MSRALFPGISTEEDEAEMRETLARKDAAVFVLEDEDDRRLSGYVEAGARAIADGCRTSPVGYVEAWYVDSEARRAGHGRALLEAAEEWAREQGYEEMASDALIGNLVSHRAHEQSGYEEVDRVITYRKDLRAAPRGRGIR